MTSPTTHQDKAMNDQIQELQARIADLESQLYAIGSGGEGQSIKLPVQADTVLPVSVPTGWKLVPVKHTLDMSIAFAETWYSERRCIDDPDMQDAWQSMIDAAPEAPEAPAQQKPVAWIEHEWGGTGVRHLHFEKREPTVRDEVVNPVWTPLYTPPPQRQPLTDEQMWADDGIMSVNAGLGLLMKDIALLVRAIEQAHNITGDQQ